MKRQHRTAATPATEGAPVPLKLPYHDILVGDLLGAIARHQIEPFLGTGTGQGIAWFNEESTVAEVMEKFVSEAAATLEKTRAGYESKA